MRNLNATNPLLGEKEQRVLPSPLPSSCQHPPRQQNDQVLIAERMSRQQQQTN